MTNSDLLTDSSYSKDLPLQIPLHLRHRPDPRQPKRPQLSPRPREILHREIRPHPHQQRPLLIQHVHALPRRRDHVPVPRHLESVRDVIWREIDGPLIRQTGSVVAEIVGVDGVLACLVVTDAAGAGGRNVAADGARVGNVDGTMAGGEGDTVGLGERVFDEVDGAGGMSEAVCGGGELGRGVGEVVEVSVVCPRGFSCCAWTSSFGMGKG